MRLLSRSALLLHLLAAAAWLPAAQAVPTLDPPPSLAYVPSAAGRLPSHDVIEPADVELYPLVLVSTLSGGLHALDRDTGEEKWGIPPTLPASSSSERAPSAGLSSAGDDDDGPTERFLVDPREGMVFLATRKAAQWHVSKLGVTVPDLVQASFQSSPVHFASDPNPARLFVGSQSTALLAVDMATGEIVNAVENGPPSDGAPLEPAPSAHASALDDLLDGLERPDGNEPKRQILWLTRTDYELRVHTPSFPPSPPQTLVYTTFSPRSAPTQHPASVFSLPHSLDAQYHQLAVTPARTGLACLQETSSGALVMLWGREFEAEYPVGVWDVFALRETGGLFVGRQVNPQRALIKTVRVGDGILVVRGGTARGPDLLALSTESYPFLGIVDALPPPSTGSLEGWHPTGPTPLLDEGYGGVSRDVWDAQLGGEMARAVERRLIESGEGGAQADNLSADAGLDPRLVRRSLGRRLAKWIGLALLCGLLAYVGRLATSPTSLLPARNVIASSPAPPGKFAFDSPKEPILLPTALASLPVDETDDQSTIPAVLRAPSPSPPPLPDAADEGKKKKRRQKRKGKKDDDEPDADPAADRPTMTDPPAPSAALVSAQMTPVLPSPEAAPVLAPVAALSSAAIAAPEALTISDELLGTGSHGTLVFKGTFQSRPVAVKRLLSHFTSLHMREITLLQSSDHHENIVRYFYQEHREPWLLIALELCPCSLGELVERGDKGDGAIWDQWRGHEEEALKGAVQGVEHLHSLKICHRDIKPQNILVTLTKSNSIRLLISDFGLAKQQTLDQSSFGATLYSASATGHLPTGSPGWRAPELLLDSGSDEAGDWELVGEGSGSGSGGGKLAGRSARLSRKVDVFALGCVIGWALSGGVHPFGDRLERERNITLNRPSYRALDPVRQQEAQNLVSRMVAFDSRARPSLPFVLQHPCFWPPGRQLGFLQDASDRFEILERDPPHPWLVALEQRARRVIPAGGWMAAMSPDFVDSLGKYRKYDVGSLRDLLRALRNKRHHFLDMPAGLRGELSPLPAGFLGYFQRRFPLLLTQVVEVVEATDMVHDDAFRSYFPQGRYVAS